MASGGEGADHGGGAGAGRYDCWRCGPAWRFAQPSAGPAVRRSTSFVEIALGNGRSLKVDEDIDPAVLARLAGALDGGKR